jgi:sodium transport system permease protein
MFLTSSPWKTLMLDRWPSLGACVAGVLLGVLLHPVGQQLVVWISTIYPVGDQVVASSRSMVEMLDKAPYWWMPFVLIALLPAVCEELAFRGFILAGFRRLGHKWWAIGLSAVFFGLAHTVLQQSMAAIVLGFALGFLAIQTGHLVPSMLFHLTYNSLMLLSSRWAEWLPSTAERPAVLRWVFHEVAPGQFLYGPVVVVVCSIFAGGVFLWLHRLPYQRTEEERIQELRDRQLRQPARDVPLDAAAARG